MKRTRRGGQRNIQRREPELYAINEKIRVPKVMLIGTEGPIGETATYKAIEIAQEEGLDVVLVGPKAEPPVAKIMDYASFKYQKQKEARKQKAKIKKSELKVLRLSPRIGQHDLDVRMRKAMQFIEKGDKVKVEVILKGREKAHADLGYEVVNNFIKTIQEKANIKVESNAKRIGSRIEALFAPNS